MRMVLAALAVLWVGCPDKSPPKLMELAALGIRVQAPAQLVVDPESAAEMAAWGKRAGALEMESRAWKLPEGAVFKVAFSNAILRLPGGASGQPAGDVLSLVFESIVKAVEDSGGKTKGLQRQRLDRGLAYSWKLDVQGTQVSTRGFLVSVQARGLRHLSAQCAAPPGDPRCEELMRGLVFETPEGALRLDEPVIEIRP